MHTPDFSLSLQSMYPAHNLLILWSLCRGRWGWNNFHNRFRGAIGSTIFYFVRSYMYDKYFRKLSAYSQWTCCRSIVWAFCRGPALIFPKTQDLYSQKKSYWDCRLFGHWYGPCTITTPSLCSLYTEPA